MALDYCDPYCSGEYQHTFFVNLKSILLGAVESVGGPNVESFRWTTSPEIKGQVLILSRLVPKERCLSAGVVIVCCSEELSCAALTLVSQLVVESTSQVKMA